MTVRLLVERNGDREGVVLEVSDTGIIKYYIISGCQFMQSNNDNDWSSILGVGIAENLPSRVNQLYATCTRVRILNQRVSFLSTMGLDNCLLTTVSQVDRARDEFSTSGLRLNKFNHQSCHPRRKEIKTRSTSKGHRRD